MAASGSKQVEESLSVVLDTNVVVGASFNPKSASARILDGIRKGRLRLVWDEATRRETEAIVRKIPPLSWSPVEELFRLEDRYEGEVDPGAFSFVEDPDDRKFIALAAATGSTLITMDDHLLGERARTKVPVCRPGEFLERL